MSSSSSVAVSDFPPVSLERYLNKQDGWEEDAKMIADQLYQVGILVIKDPRVDMKENDKFIDMMEQYFEQPDNIKAKDVRKEFHYQVGVTPDNVEQARAHCDKVKLLDEDDKPATICPPEVDKKGRFFWRIGARPEKTEFPSLNVEQVVPEAFKDRWAQTMDRWGGFLLNTCTTVAELAALGFGLDKDAFASKMNLAPHLLAPTASDLVKFGSKGTVFAGYHYDLNFMTIHGKSRYPGLFAWTRSGKKLKVVVPDGCLLLQSGKQFEWITGGHVLAGFHEVVVTDDTLAAVERAKQEKRSLWRISSTLFSHIASDQYLTPVGKFGTEEALKKYPAIKAGQQVRDELDAIKLATHKEDVLVSM